LLPLRFPLLQFLLLGAIAFRVVHGPHPFAAVARREAAGPVVVTAAQVARMREDYAQETGLAPDEDDEAALIDRWIDEELLHREAQARGLDRNDRSVRAWLVEQARVLEDEAAGRPGPPGGAPGVRAEDSALYERALDLGLDRKDLVVRRIIVQKMRLLASRAGEENVTDEELRAFHAAHADDFRSPTRVTLRQVFFGSAGGGAGARVAAEALLRDLRSRRVADDEVLDRGETFAAPPRLVAQSPRQLEKLFGAEFTREIERAPIGTWSGPFASSAGLHLVLVEERDGPSLPSLESVRGRVLESWRERRRTERLAAFVRDLRARQPIEVESEAWRARARR